MNLVPYIFDGVILGALYSIVALGMVIVYQTTRVLNFAQAGIATSSAFIAWKLMTLGWSYPLALVVAVCCGVALGALVGFFLSTLSQRTSPLAKTVMTFGVTLILTWVNRESFGRDGQFISRVFDSDVQIAGVGVSGHGLYVLTIAALSIFATLLLLYRTKIGLAMRALSQDPETARSHGIAVRHVTVMSWSIASGLGALSGVLVASFIIVDHSVMTTILIYSLIAQVIGGFGSPLGAIVGGIGLGVVSSLMSATSFSDYRTTMVFGAMLLILLFRPYGILGKPELNIGESGAHMSGPPLPRPWRRSSAIAPVIILVFAVAIPFLPIPWSLSVFAVMFATAIAVIALGVLLGYIGELSVGHGAFVLTGAYTVAISANAFPQVSLPLLIIGAIGLTSILGLLVGIFALRLSGLYLMIVTIVVNFVVIEMALQLRPITGGATGLSLKEGPWFVTRFDSAISTYWLAVTMFFLAWFCASLVLRSRVGQKWVAARDSPRAASAFGIRPNLQRVSAFVFSAALAGLAGGVLVIIIGHVGPNGYGLHWSILLLLAVVVGGAGSMVGSLVGAAIVTLIPIIFTRSSGAVDLLFGAVLIIVLAFAPDGIRSVRRFTSRKAVKGVPADMTRQSSSSDGPVPSEVH